MIDIKKLEAIKTIVTHDNCPDGLASAILLHDALPAAEIRFMSYGTRALAELAATEGMLFCDFTPPADRVGEFVAAGALVLDHHKSARGVVEAFGEDGVFADEAKDPGVSGAVLAFREVWDRLHAAGKIERGENARQRAESFALVAGVRDTWQKDSPLWEHACAQAEALMFWRRETWLHGTTRVPPYFDDIGYSHLEKLLDIGPTLIAKKREACERAIAEAHRFTTRKGTRVLCYDGTATTSDAAELAQDYDLLVGWHYRVDAGHRQLNFSCRSRGTFDCAALAKFYGGGGHTGAAGFTLDAMPGAALSLDPYSRVSAAVEGFEADRGT